MMTPDRYASRTVPELTYIEYVILLTLVRRARTGIGIFEEVVYSTNRQIVLSPGTLYTALKRLLAQQWIHMVEPSQGAKHHADPRRKYYLATALGRKQLMAMAEWMGQEKALIKQELQFIQPSTPMEMLQNYNIGTRRGRRYGRNKRSSVPKSTPS